METKEIIKMLRAIANGQSHLREDMNTGFERFDKRFEDMDLKIEGLDKKLTKRIDTLGESIAYMEDDLPRRQGGHSNSSRI